MWPFFIDPDKLDFHEFGILAEKKARVFLIKKGWRIIKRNYRLKFAEIDIVARDNKTIVFIEVKSRRLKNNVNNFPALFAVNKKKQNKIINAAKIIGENFKDANFRFDIISVYYTLHSWSFEHIENAYILE